MRPDLSSPERPASGGPSLLDPSRPKPSRCELCGSGADYLNFHHLIPRTLHGKRWYLDRYERSHMQARGLWVCKFHCHRELHALVTEKEMGRTYNTRDALLAHPGVAGYVRWRSSRVA